MSSDTAFPEAPASTTLRAPTFANNLEIMWRVVFALMIRESRTRYGKTDLGYLWALIDPTMQLIIFWILFTILQRVPPVPADMPVFLMTGILPYNFWRGCISRGASATSANLPLLTYPQVRVFDVVLARVLLDITTFAVVTVVIVIGLRFLYGEQFTNWVRDPFVLGTAILMLFYFSLSASIFSANMARLFPIWMDVWAYLNRPLYYTSGIFFTLSSLPTGFRAIAQWIPMAHMLEWIRTGAIPGFVSTFYNPLYIFSWATALLIIGMTIDWGLRLTGHAD